MADSNNGSANQNQGAPENGQAPELQELAQYKQFFEGVAPILEKLDASPELVKAILEDKLSPEFAKAALDGKLTVEQEAAVQAAAAVENAASATGLTKEEAEALFKDKLEGIKSEILEKSEEKDYERYTNEFIDSRSDWDEYAGEIAKWIDAHPQVTDVAVAYYAVKGQISETKAREAAAQASAEEAKNVLLNAASGGSPSTAVVQDRNVIDALIASTPNPNRL